MLPLLLLLLLDDVVVAAAGGDRRPSRHGAPSAAPAFNVAAALRVAGPSGVVVARVIVLQRGGGGEGNGEGV